MILVTVGTDHHPFDRLIREVDRLKEKDWIQGDVFIQKGSSSYRPQCCLYRDIISFNQLMEKMNEARITITHGGPGTIMPLLYQRKVPVVVPRLKKYGEAVDDHQVSFARKLEKDGKILAVYDIQDLRLKIFHYNEMVGRLKKQFSKRGTSEDRTVQFIQKLQKITHNLLKK